MAQHWAPQMASGIQADSEYFPLHQQRRYLLENLVNEEARRENFVNMLEVNNVKLSAVQNSGESIMMLKKSSANLRRKMMTSQSTEKLLAQNLAVINARMNYLEQTQWRRAISNHDQCLEYSQIDRLTAGMQGMVVSPIAYGFPTTHGTSDFISPMSPIFIPPWTLVYPAPLEGYQLFSPTTTPQPSFSFPLEQVIPQLPSAHIFRHGEAYDNSNTTLQIDTTSPLYIPVQDFVPAQRALSLPDIGTAQHHSSDNTSAEEHPETGNSFGLTRNQSLVNQSRSGLRMQRMFS
jgi:hypothetical protein